MTRLPHGACLTNLPGYAVYIEAAHWATLEHGLPELRTALQHGERLEVETAAP